MTARKPKVKQVVSYRRLAAALLTTNLVAVGLFGLRSVETLTDRYWFLLWNLFLAWLPLALAWLLVQNLVLQRWSTWKNVVLTLMWLGFLPNSFYLLSDLIHLHSTGEVSLLYDIVMFSAFVFNGFVAGFASLYLVHRQLLERWGQQLGHSAAALVLLACSFAIYLGRSLRWNSWDVLVNPAGLLFDVSDRIINPVAHPQAFVTTVIFFMLLASTYWVVWETVDVIRRSNGK